MYNIYNILTHAHTEKKRAAVTSLGHRRQRWQMGTPLSLSNKDLSLSISLVVISRVFFLFLLHKHFINKNKILSPAM
jgi:hypothetical protein